VERNTRFTVLVQLDNREMGTLTEGLRRMMPPLPEQVRRSLTWDRGMELADHKNVTAQTGMAVYFADPRSPWQRGTNENTNRLLRQYLPKGVSMGGLTQADLDKVAARLNNRPPQGTGLRHPRRTAQHHLGCRALSNADLPDDWPGWKDGRMADMRRRDPEPPPGMPEIQFKPGMADELMAELAPLLAEEGIDINNMDVDDIDTLQQAMNRAIERRNMALFTPVGEVRQIAAVTLRLIVEAILDGDSRLAGAILDQVQPESPDNAVATVASCIGIALGLLDEWLSRRDGSAPANLAAHTVLPKGHWTGERAATHVLVLAGKGRAFRSLHTLITGQGSPQLLAGSALALAAATDAWARHEDTPRAELVRTIIR
jgi:hypothetical protein